MTTAHSVEAMIDSYLARVRVKLRGLPEHEIDDIVNELRGHVLDLAGREGTGVEAAIQSLGDPADLAETYLAENQMVRAECSGSPFVILQGLRHASSSAWGRKAATALYLFGYINMGAAWAAAIDKLLAPSRTGLYTLPGRIASITLVKDGNAPAGAHELLGWWLVPIAGLVGWAVKYGTDRVAQWWISRYRRLKALREA